LKKQHNIEFDEKIHRYVEQDPNIHKIIEGCLTTDNKNTSTRPAAKRHKGPASTYASANLENDSASGLHAMYLGHSSF
jgi:hypothetical protein